VRTCAAILLALCCSLSSNIILACCFDVKGAALCIMHNVVCHVLQLMLSSKLHGSAAVFVCIILFLFVYFMLQYCVMRNSDGHVLLSWLLSTLCNVICPTKAPTFYKTHQL